MNLPNKLTLLRICLIPLCLLLWALELPVWAAAVFALAAATDFFDGYIARKRNIVTVFGKFADPVADKLLVLTAMIMLTEQGLLPARRKLPADYLVRLTARTMEERARRRRIYRELFRDFRETAVGMMENIQEAEETAEHFLDQLSADLHRGIGKGRKG